MRGLPRSAVRVGVEKVVVMGVASRGGAGAGGDGVDMRVGMHVGVCMSVDVRRLEATTIQENGSGGEGGNGARVVGGQHHGLPQRLQVGEEAFGRHRIERVGWLVEEQHVRFHGEYGGERNQALFAARELVRDALGEAVEAESVEGAFGDSTCLRSATAKVEGTERYVFEDGRAEQLIVGVLEEQASALADFAEPFLIDAVDAKGFDAAGGRPHEADHDPQQSRLAGAVSADQRHPLPRVKLKVGTVQNGVTSRVGKGDTTETEERIVHRSASAARRMAGTAARAAAASESVRRQRIASRL